MSTDSRPAAVISLEEALRIKNERDALEAQIRHLSDRLQETNKRLEVISAYMNPEARAIIYGQSGPAAHDRSAPTWGEAIIDVLTRAGRGMTYFQVMEELKKTALREKVERNSNGFYTAVKKLMGSKQIMKHGKLLYLADLFKQMHNAGATIPTDDPASPQRPANTSSTPALILGILGKHPDGLRGIDIIEKLLANPEVSQSVRVHRQYIYTVLGKMVAQTKLTKDGLTYRIAGQPALTLWENPKMTTPGKR